MGEVDKTIITNQIKGDIEECYALELLFYSVMEECFV